MVLTDRTRIGLAGVQTEGLSGFRGPLVSARGQAIYYQRLRRGAAGAGSFGTGPQRRTGTQSVCLRPGADGTGASSGG